jgi:hypothetical protein
MLRQSYISKLMSNKCSSKNCRIQINTSSTLLAITPYFNADGEMMVSDNNRYIHTLYCLVCNKSMSVEEYQDNAKILQEFNCNDD